MVGLKIEAVFRKHQAIRWNIFNIIGTRGPSHLILQRSFPGILEKLFQKKSLKTLMERQEKLAFIGYCKNNDPTKAILSLRRS